LGRRRIRIPNVGLGVRMLRKGWVGRMSGHRRQLRVVRLRRRRMHCLRSWGLKVRDMGSNYFGFPFPLEFGEDVFTHAILIEL